MVEGVELVGRLFGGGGLLGRTRNISEGGFEGVRGVQGKRNIREVG
jgi:hypothetical protein